jgi:hypothetical protein
MFSGIKYYTNKNSYNLYKDISYPVIGRVMSHQKESLDMVTHYYITFEFVLPSDVIYDNGYSSTPKKQMTLSTICYNTSRMDECMRIMENIFTKNSVLVNLVYINTQPNPSIHLHNDNPYYIAMLDWEHTFKSTMVMSFVMFYIFITIALVNSGKISKSVYAVILTVSIAVILGICVYIITNNSYDKNYHDWSIRQIDLTIKKVNKNVITNDEYVHPRDSSRINTLTQTIIFEFEFEDNIDFHTYHHVSLPKAIIKCPNKLFPYYNEETIDDCVHHYERYFKVGDSIHAYFNRFDDQTLYINEKFNSISVVNGTIYTMTLLLFVVLMASTAFTGGMTYGEIKKHN